MKILRAENISCSYDEKKEVVKYFSTEICKGDFTFIIGPNGAGKSTLFKALSGFLPVSSGNIFICDSDIQKLKASKRAEYVGVVPQNVYNNMPFTVREIVEMGRASRLGKFSRMKKADIDLIEKAMADMEVDKYANKLFNQLSGGERQRVLVAMALAQSPSLLLLDEPTSHLDIGHTSHLMDRLQRINRTSNIATVIITHDILLASRFASEIIILKDGSKMVQGKPQVVLTPENIKSAYNHSDSLDYTKLFK